MSGKKRRLAKERREIREDKGFYEYLIKKHEILTIMLEYNIPNNIDPSEEYIDFLKEEYVAFDTSSLPWVQHETKPVQDVSQLTIKNVITAE